jgi:hypothetical protein
MTTLNTTPRADGFRMPAEWEPHSQTWMVWPERPDNWRLGGKPAQAAFAAVAKAIAEFEPVTVCVSAGQYENARVRLDADNIRLVEISTDDAWVRDTGPTFVTNASGEVRGVDWTFNAWGGFDGGLYWPWQRDDQVARKILEIERCPRYRTEGFVLEGGSIHVDGEGTLITTEECLLNRNRNPHLSREQIEAVLREQLAIDRVIWLPDGLFNDETDGHVDNFCCYVRPGPKLPAGPGPIARGETRARRQGPPAGRAQDADPRADPRQRRRVRRRRCRRGQPGTRSVDPPGRLLRQLPDRQRRHRRAEFRRRQGRRGPRHSGTGLPRAPRSDGARPRDPPRRRQYPLHHPAAAGAARALNRRAGRAQRPACNARRVLSGSSWRSAW